MSYSYSIQGGAAPAFSSRKSMQPQPPPPQQYSQYDEYDQYDQYDPYSYNQQYQQEYQQKLQVRDTTPPQNSLQTPNQSSGRFSHRPTSSVYSQVSFIDPATQTLRQAPSQPTEQPPPPPPPKPYQYSEPSYDNTDRRTRYQNQPQAWPHGVSPESSPDRSTTRISHGNNNMSATPSVSSIGSAADGPASASRSNIPSIRRERRASQTSTGRSLREATSRERLQQTQDPSGLSPTPASKRGYKGGEVRWDPRTGELTSSQKGRPSQVKPIEYARGFAPTDTAPGSPMESAHEDPKNEVANLASRLRKTADLPRAEKAIPASPTPAVSLRSVSAAVAPSPPRESTDPAAGAFTSNRPAWHGASGRTTLVAPVHDTHDVAPLNIPRRSSKRVGSVPQLRNGTAGSSLLSPPASPSPRGAETQGQQAKTIKTAALLGQISARTSTTQATKASITSTPSASSARNYPSPPLRETSSTSALRNRTPSHQNLASFDASDPFNYNNRANPSLAVAPPELRPPVKEPTDWNETIHESANESDSNDTSTMSSNNVRAPSQPTTPFLIKRRPTAQSLANSLTPDYAAYNGSSSSLVPPKSPTPSDSDSVMERRRPPRLGHNKTGIEPVVISLSSPYIVDAPSLVQEKRGRGNDTGNGSTPLYNQLRSKSRPGAAGEAGGADQESDYGSIIYKTLPPAPPETSARDRVAMLNAQLTNLAQRRANINRSIKQMTELMPTDNLLATPDVLHKREMEKLKVESLRLDLAEIQREQYEIGLKLHRAYKRLDKNAEYEPTTLWVRRVTG